MKTKFHLLIFIFITNENLYCPLLLSKISPNELYPFMFAFKEAASFVGRHFLSFDVILYSLSSGSNQPT